MMYFMFDIDIKNSSVDYQVKFYACIQVHYEVKTILSSSLMIKMTLTRFLYNFIIVYD